MDKQEKIRKVFGNILKQAGIPMLIALAITLYDVYEKKQPFSFMDSAKVYFPALFFIMYFVGQYKRVEKQTEDRESFRGLNDGLATLQEMVGQLQREPAGSQEPSVVPLDSAHKLLSDSTSLYKSGHSLAALLQAGVAFEHAVRNFSSKLDVDGFEDMPLMKLIDRISPQLGGGIVGELHALRKIRNRITHIREEELVELPDVGKVLSHYKWAINALDERLGFVRSA